jgi:hypothetical protein
MKTETILLLIIVALGLYSVSMSQKKTIVYGDYGYMRPYWGWGRNNYHGHHHEGRHHRR